MNQTESNSQNPQVNEDIQKLQKLIIHMSLQDQLSF